MESNYFSLKNSQFGKSLELLSKRFTYFCEIFPQRKSLHFATKFAVRLFLFPLILPRCPFGAILCKKTMLCRHSERNFL